MSESSTALKIISGALELPGVKVDRKSFLIETLKVSSEDTYKLLELGPIKSGLFTQAQIKKVAETVSNKRRWQTTSVSASAGLPGGVAMAATIPADTAQYFGFCLRLAQEIAYLYGAEDFWEDGKINDKKVKSELMLYLGTMLGVSGAASAIRYISQNLGKKVAKDLTKTALTKTFWYPLLKSIGKYLGIKITKDTVARGAAKVIPILGGLFSGGMTYYTISKMSQRLIKELDKGVIYTAAEQEVDLEAIKEEMPEVYEAIYEEIK